MPPTKKAGERNEPADDQRNDGKVECTCSRRRRYVFNLLSDFVLAFACSSPSDAFHFHSRKIT